MLAEIVPTAGLPAGVFNLVHGGPDTGRALVDAGVDGMAFTGSAEVGREIARKLQDGPYARPALTEMGGKNPAIVTASADLDARRRGRGALRVRALGPEVQRVLAGDRASTRCTTSSWSGSPRGRASSRSATRASARRSWGR